MKRESRKRLRRLLKIDADPEAFLNDYRDRWTDADVIDIVKDYEKQLYKIKKALRECEAR